MPPTIAARPYQIAANDANAAAFLDAGTNRLLQKMPTGTGKTFTFARLLTHPRIEHWLAQFPPIDRRMMVIAHREELLDQAAATIKAANPGLMVMVEQGDRHASHYADVVVASIQTLSAMKFRRLQRLVDRATYRIVIVDEAHHAAAATYRTALVHLGFLPPADASDQDDIEAATHDDVLEMTKSLESWDRVAPKDRLLLGVTATPNRSDAIGLGCVFQSIAFSYDLKQAIEDRWLVPIVPWAIETKTSLDSVHLARGDFNQRELADTVNNPSRNLLALASWQQYARDVPTIGFTVDVAHAHEMQRLFEQAGHRAAAISGETPRDDRRLTLQQYTAGQIDVLFNCMVLTEGTDLPRTACILHCKPTKSATLYEQMTGRGLRLFPGKNACVVIDMVDVARRHSLQTAPILYGLPPGVAVKGKKLNDVADEFDELMRQHPGMDLEQLLANGPQTLEQLGAMANKVDIWSIPALGDFGAGRQMSWLKINDTCYRIQYPWADGSETIEVLKDLIDKWDVVITMKPRDYNAPRRQRTIATQLPTPLAAADAAEAFMRRERQSAAKLKSADAPWMKRPATEKQVNLMKKMHVRIPSHCTSGQASQLIDLAMARKGRH